jgi:cytochrome c-type biogenesis protein CcmH/NrfF
MSTKPAVAEPKRRNWVLWTLRKVALIVAGVVLYAVCIGMFGGYPQFHTALLTWIAVVGLSVAAGIIWIVDERRTDDDD